MRQSVAAVRVLFICYFGTKFLLRNREVFAILILDLLLLRLSLLLFLFLTYFVYHSNDLFTFHDEFAWLLSVSFSLSLSLPLSLFLFKLAHICVCFSSLRFFVAFACSTTICRICLKMRFDAVGVEIWIFVILFLTFVL